jgi:hypothetical protein
MTATAEAMLSVPRGRDVVPHRQHVQVLQRVLERVPDLEQRRAAEEGARGGGEGAEAGRRVHVSGDCIGAIPPQSAAR